MSEKRTSVIWPIALSAILALFIFGWLAWESGRGGLSQDSEFYTAERSREMLLLGPWAVHDNFQLSGVKPPLQYWLSAFTLARFPNPMFALRIWTLLYGLLAAAALGWLAAMADRPRPWLIAISIALLLLCPLFLRTAYSALLDSGLMFFVTLVLASAQAARNRPAWWALTALACWLGALQKTPLILVVWVIIILLRLRNAEERQMLRTQWLYWTFAVALFAVTLWPWIQIMKFGLSPAEVLRYREPLIIAQRRAGAPYLDAPFRLITFWPCGLFALIATAILPWIRRIKPGPIAIELSLFCWCVIALCILSNTRQVNYLVPILPALCLILGLSLRALSAQAGSACRVLIAVVALCALAGLPITQIWIAHVQEAHWRSGVRRDLSDHAAMARALAIRQDTTAKPFVVIEADNDMLPEEFYLFQAGLKSHLSNITLAQLNRTAPTPMVGLCTANDFGQVQKQFPGVRIDLALHDLVCWEVD